MNRFYVDSNGIYSANAYINYSKTYGAYSIGDTLTTGRTLYHDQYLASSNGSFIAKMQADRNFVVYSTDQALWSTETSNPNAGYKNLKLQYDGNIVVYDSNNNAAWNIWSNTNIYHPVAVRLKMQNDGNLVAYTANNTPVWYIGTHNSGTGEFNVINELDKNSKLSYINGAFT